MWYLTDEFNGTKHCAHACNLVNIHNNPSMFMQHLQEMMCKQCANLIKDVGEGELVAHSAVWNKPKDKTGYIKFRFMKNDVEFKHSVLITFGKYVNYVTTQILE